MSVEVFSPQEARAYLEEFELTGYRIGQLVVDVTYVQDKIYVDDYMPHADQGYDSNGYFLRTTPKTHYKTQLLVDEIDLFADNAGQQARKKISLSEILNPYTGMEQYSSSDPDPTAVRHEERDREGNLIVTHYLGKKNLSRDDRYAIAEYRGEDGSIQRESIVFSKAGQDSNNNAEYEADALHAAIWPIPEAA